MSMASSFILLLLGIVYFELSTTLPLQQSSSSESQETGVRSRTSRQAMQIEVVARDVPKQMENDVAKMAEQVLAKLGTGSTGASEIGRKMNAKYGGYWQVISYSADANAGFAQHVKQHILLEIDGETRMLIYLPGVGF